MNSKLGLISFAASLTALVSFIACTDYQEEFDNNFGMLAYESYVESSETNQDVSSGSVDLSSTTDKVSSGAEPLSSGSVPTQSSGEQSYSSVGSSGSAKTSSSSTASLSGYNPPAGNYGEVEYKGQKYRTVTIGDQEWMAENLNYAVDGSYCYNDAAQNCDKFGRLYSWEAATNACTEGWHLPDSMEWTVLFKSVGTDAATHLKATSGWDSNTAGNGDDAVGFSVLPAGGGSISGGIVYYSSLTNGAVFWTNEKIGDSEARSVSIYGKDKNPEFIEGIVNDRRSVRCIKDAKPSSSSSVESSSSMTSCIPEKENCIIDGRDGQIYKTVQIEDQVWMAQNLNYKTDDSYCYGEKNPQFTSDKCEKYGRLYRIKETLEMTDGVCPQGWHVPDTTEWVTLFDAVDGRTVAGIYLKSKTDWKEGNANVSGIDSYGFTALPGGLGKSGSAYDLVNVGAYFLSTTKSVHCDCMETINFVYSTGDASFSQCGIHEAVSIRCLKGEPRSSSSSAKSSSSSQSSSSAKSSSSSVQSSSSLVFETVKESILGDQYLTVEYNPGETDRSVHQKWMAENLHYWDESLSSPQATTYTCYDENYVREQDKEFDLCEIYGFYYSEAEALSILDKLSDDCWILPDSQTVKALVGIVNGDLNQIYSVDMKGNNASKFNLLSAGYYDRNGFFFPVTHTENPQLKTCFWIRTGTQNELLASCFYSRSNNGEVAEKRTTENPNDSYKKARLPIRLIYNQSCSK